jgi:hypothetical protein
MWLPYSSAFFASLAVAAMAARRAAADGVSAPVMANSVPQYSLRTL